ncbi:MAG TPA: energy transducer TonB [Xanthomonadaceae bacterium]|nr:energy transducer TonB [Xanthomonadaceae bacterium]
MARALMLGFLLLTGNSATALSPAAYPHLMEFGDALAAYQRGDLVEARVAFRHLAELGHPEARFNLGVMLLKGEGGETDEAEALAWMRWAMQDGDASAAQAMPTVEAALSPAQQLSAGVTLERLRATHDAVAMMHAKPLRHASEGCLVEHMQRSPPQYPDQSARERQIGYAVLHFLVSPEGNADAVHAMPTLIRDDRFAEPARRAVRRWHAHACPATGYRHLTQVITFDLHGRSGYSDAALAWAQDILDSARNGNPAHAYVVAELDARLDGLFQLEPAERGLLMQSAAVAGMAEARYALSEQLARSMPDHAARWEVLAARQGFAPALVAVTRRNDLHADARREALIRAAREGFLPAVLLGVRRLATHPLDEERDGVLALSLTSNLPSQVLRSDPSMAQAHAAALAENGRFKEAVEWQQRALRVGRRLNSAWPPIAPATPGAMAHLSERTNSIATGMQAPEPPRLLRERTAPILVAGCATARPRRGRARC